jgi:ribosomal protein L10
MNSFLKMKNIRKKIRQGQVKLKVKRKRWINMWLRGSVCSNLLMIAFSNKD